MLAKSMVNCHGLNVRMSTVGTVESKRKRALVTVQPGGQDGRRDFGITRAKGLHPDERSAFAAGPRLATESATGIATGVALAGAGRACRPNQRQSLHLAVRG